MSIHRFEDAAFLQDFFLHDINKRGWFSRLLDGFQRERFPELPSGVVRSITAHTMMRADPIYVSDDAMTLWEHAAPSFELEPLRRDDLVIPAGFALLPRPWAIKDMHGKTVRYRAIAWLPISQKETFNWDQGAEGQGVWLSLLSNVNDIDDYWTENHILSDGTTGSVVRDVSLAMGEEWTLMHGSPVMFDKSPGYGILDHSSGEAKVITDEPAVKLAATVYAEVQCFWRLMSQLVMTPEPLPRQARRQRQRAQRIDTVKVLHLRRYRHRMDHEGEGPGVEYSHRFIVSGHWRKQPYGPRANPEYRQIWIAPYVKGPDDKPLVVKERGVEFDR